MYLTEYRAMFGERSHENRTANGLAKGMTHEFFTQTKSKLRRSLNTKLGRTRAAAYEIVATGQRGSQQFSLDLPSSAIRFAGIDSSARRDLRGGKLAK